MNIKWKNTRQLKYNRSILSQPRRAKEKMRSRTLFFHLVQSSPLAIVCSGRGEMEIIKAEELNPDFFPEHNPIDLHTEQGD